MIDVSCLRCNAKIAEYSGPLGFHVPVKSKFYTRIDGSQPTHGSSTAHKCPNCGETINELDATLAAADKYLAEHPENENDKVIEHGNP